MNRFLFPLIFLAMISANESQAQTKTRLLYFFDPLCGWCYGFSPVIKQIAEEGKDSLEVEAITGGMMTGEREGPLGHFSSYILGAIPRVEEYTGVKFGEGYKKMIADSNHFSSSVKPCIAVNVAKMLKPEIGVAFASEIQQIHFAEGYDLNVDDTYKVLAERFGLNGEEFLKAMKEDKNKVLTEQEFARTQRFGVSGFPCLVAERNGQYYLVSSGFRKKEEVLEVLKNLEEEKK
jgi:putative protein-disulfide isomerase